MKPIRRWLTLFLVTCLTAIAIIACNSGGGDSDTIRVGSKDFTEQFILGEMYALVLEDQGLNVERKLNLGGTPVAQASLQSDQIDLYPEYTGTGLLTVLKEPTSSDQKQVYETVSQGYKEKYNLVWLDPAPMNNTQALAMTAEKSQQQNIKTLSQMVAKASELVMLGPPEFQEREDGLPGLKKAYGDFQLKEYKSVEMGLRYRGLIDNQGDVVVASGTDGEISAYNLVLLEDDRNLFPPYQVAPVVRQEVLDQHPEIREALNALSSKLTNETMQRLNYQVSGEQQEPAAVAKAFLVQEGMISE